MTLRPWPLRSAIFAGVLAIGLSACGERLPVRYIGDAIPRSRSDSTLLDVVRPLLQDSANKRDVIKRWTASAPDLGIGESEQANTFIADPSIVAVVGHAGSKSTLIAKPLYAQAGMPLIVPTATARSVGDPAAGIFTLAPPDNVVGAFMIDEAVDRLRARRVGLMHIADAYGDGVRNGVAERAHERGDSLAGVVALSGRECESDGLALDAIVRAFLQRVKPDAVILVLPQRTTWCAVRRLVAQQPDITIIASDSFTLMSDVPLTPAERAHLYSLVFWLPGTDSVSQQFVARTRAVFHRDPDAGEALTYDAFRLVAAAIREGNSTRAAIGNWIRQLGTPGHPPFQGITGPIEFRSPRKSLLHLKSLADGGSGS